MAVILTEAAICVNKGFNIENLAMTVEWIYSSNFSLHKSESMSASTDVTPMDLQLREQRAQS